MAAIEQEQKTYIEYAFNHIKFFTTILELILTKDIQGPEINLNTPPQHTDREISSELLLKNKKELYRTLLKYINKLSKNEGDYQQQSMMKKKELYNTLLKYINKLSNTAEQGDNMKENRQKELYKTLLNYLQMLQKPKKTKKKKK